jgi:hypothetical protein
MYPAYGKTQCCGFAIVFIFCFACITESPPLNLERGLAPSPLVSKECTFFPPSDFASIPAFFLSLIDIFTSSSFLFWA